MTSRSDSPVQIQAERHDLRSRSDFPVISVGEVTRQEAGAVERVDEPRLGLGVIEQGDDQHYSDGRRPVASAWRRASRRRGPRSGRRTGDDQHRRLGVEPRGGEDHDESGAARRRREEDGRERGVWVWGADVAMVVVVVFSVERERGEREKREKTDLEREKREKLWLGFF